MTRPGSPRVVRSMCPMWYTLYHNDQFGCTMSSSNLATLETESPSPLADDPAADAHELLALPSGPLLTMFERLANRWELGRDERLRLLGIRSATTYGRWRAAPDRANLDLGTRERMGHVMGIHAATVALFGPGEASSGWVKRPNSGPLFRGTAPIDRMASGLTGALAEVRRYLELELAR